METIEELASQATKIMEKATGLREDKKLKKLTAAQVIAAAPAAPAAQVIAAAPSEVFSLRAQAQVPAIAQASPPVIPALTRVKVKAVAVAAAADKPVSMLKAAADLIEDATTAAVAKVVKPKKEKKKAKPEAEPVAQVTEELQETEVKKKRGIKDPVNFPTFVKARHKNSRKYVFTDDGDIGILTEGSIQKIADLPFYRDPTASEHQEFEAIQESNIEEILESIELKKKELRDAVLAFRSSGDGSDAVVSLNDEIRVLMGQKSAIEFPARWLQVSARENIKDILLEEEHEKRKMKFEVIYIKRRTKKLQDEYVRVFDPATESRESVSESASRKGLILFYTKEGDNGFLCDEWPVKFTVEGVEYSSALQAYYAEKAKYLDKADIRTEIMGTRSANKIRKRIDKLIDTEDWNKGKEAILYKIHLAKFSQHPELADVLEQTGDNKLIYANPSEKELGTGIAIGDPRLEVGKWIGTNILGKVLQKVRAKLREGEKAEVEPVVERAITEAEDDARTKAIISRRKAIKRAV